MFLQFFPIKMPTTPLVTVSVYDAPFRRTVRNWTTADADDERIQPEALLQDGPVHMRFCMDHIAM